MPMVAVFLRDMTSQGFQYPRGARVPYDLFSAKRDEQLRNLRWIGDVDEDSVDEFPAPRKAPERQVDPTQIQNVESRIRSLREQLETAEDEARRLRALAGVPEPEPRERQLDELKRDELNDLATSIGIDEPGTLPNKSAVIEAINERSATAESDQLPDHLG